MGEVIVITSGKGGVGKTTTTANIGAGLSELGKKGLENQIEIHRNSIWIIFTGEEN